MNKCVVTAIEVKEKFITVKFVENGEAKKVNIFNDSPLAEEAKALKEGQTVEMDIFTNAKNYLEVRSFGAVTQTTPAEAKSVEAVATAAHVKANSQQISIERQVSLKAAIDLCVILKVEQTKNLSVDMIVDDILKNAEKFYNYLSSTDK